MRWNAIIAPLKFVGATIDSLLLVHQALEGWMERSMDARQLVEPVLWESSLKYIIAQGKSKLVECGPGSQIKSMMRRLNPNAWKEFQNIQP